MRCPTFEVFFGGARGGGKTDGVLGEWLVHAQDWGQHAIGIMFRRSMVQLVETIERSRAIYSQLGATYQEQGKMWRFPNGARLRFAYLERDADADAYQGHSYTRVYVEEIGTFPSERPILKLMATLRSGAGVPVGFRATGNPGGPGHQWVKARYIDPAPGGWKIITDQATGLERIYIPSRVTDNVYLGRDYIQRLRASGSETLVKAWLEGDWDAIEGAFFDCWSSKNVVPPFSVPKDWVRFRSGDWGSASPFSFGWWAVVQDDFKVDRVSPGGVGTLPRGALVRYREWYGSDNPAASSKGLKITAEEMGEGIAKREQGEKLAYGVLDPRCFAVESGPSIAERINGKLLAAKCAPFRKAENKRVNATQSKDGSGPINGWDQMRARIIGQLDDKGNSTGVPMVYCFNTCLASIRTIPVLQHDPDKAEDLDTESEDHCFAAGTLVETDRGAIPIEQLVGTEGRVLTVGDKFVPYRSARMTRKNAELVFVYFDNGRMVLCTKDHRFLVDRDEWRYASDLAGRSVLCAQSSLVERSSYLMVSATTSAENTFRAKASAFISWCGNIITVPFLPVIISTTRTMIVPTMIPQTSNAFQPGSISAEGTARKAPNEVGEALRRLMPPPQRGMDQTKAENGIPAISSSISSRLWNGKLSAQRAARNAAKSIWCRLQKLHKVSTAGRIAERVRCVSVGEAGRADVYCITVPTTGCFAIEGGILVSNCADDWRYACSSRPWTRTIPKPDAPPDPYKPMNDQLSEDVQSSVKLI